MEHKTTTSATEIKASPTGEVTAVFSTLETWDHDGDWTEKGAFSGVGAVPISSYGHQSWKGSLPVGVGHIREAGNEVVVEARFFMETTAGRDTFETVRGLGPLGQWSYGYEPSVPGGSEQGTRLGRSGRILKRLQVVEVSPVLRGAGVGTRTLSAKGDGRSGDGDSSITPATRDELSKIKGALAASMAATEVRRIHASMRARDEWQRFKATSQRFEHHYEEVSPTLINAEKLAAAEAMVGATCSYLKVSPPPSLHWFVQEGERARAYAAKYGRADIGGFSHPDLLRGLCHKSSRQIWIAADLDEPSTLAVIGHEIAHLSGANELMAEVFEKAIAPSLITKEL